MVKYCSDVQRKMYNSTRQSIVNYFNAESVQQVEMVLAQVRAKARAEAGTGVRSTALQEVGFKCKCGHTEAWEYPTHDTCKKCALVKDKIHRGKAYRDIRERADLNGVGMTHNPTMSQGYNFATVPRQNADPKKRATDTHLKKMVRRNPVRMDTRDKHILRAKAEFDEISCRLHFNSTPAAALQLFASYVNSTRKLEKKKIVMAACMFHTLKKPTGKEWTKTFRKGVYNVSKKKRLKRMTFKRAN